MTATTATASPPALMRLSPDNWKLAILVGLIVSVGGGSATDAAKIVALLIKHDVRSVEAFEPLRTYVTDAGEAHRGPPPVLLGFGVAVLARQHGAEVARIAQRLRQF